MSRRRWIAGGFYELGAYVCTTRYLFGEWCILSLSTCENSGSALIRVAQNHHTVFIMSETLCGATADKGCNVYWNLRVLRKSIKSLDGTPQVFAGIVFSSHYSMQTIRIAHWKNWNVKIKVHLRTTCSTFLRINNVSVSSRLTAP